MKDPKTIAQQFFAAYDAHDVEGMTALCADDAQGRYAPYGRNSDVPIRGGLDAPLARLSERRRIKASAL
jgi:ketosteroid isomerase-like protein